MFPWRGSIRGWGDRTENEDSLEDKMRGQDAYATADDAPALVHFIHWQEPSSTNWLLVTIVTREWAQFRIF